MSKRSNRSTFVQHNSLIHFKIMCIFSINRIFMHWRIDISPLKQIQFVNYFEIDTKVN